MNWKKFRLKKYKDIKVKVKYHNGISYEILDKETMEGYKYRLLVDCSLKTKVKDYNHEDKYIKLTKDGWLTVKKGYCWDGPSGPTVDTETFMRGSLVHDVFYQLMRMSILPYEYRLISDRLLKEICLLDGMSRFRAWYVYKSVRAFSGKYARPV